MEPVNNPTPVDPSVNQTPAAPAPAEPANIQAAPAPQVGGLDFIPENYRQAGWAQKYKTPEDFFKGVDNMAKVMGQKQIVEGIKLPGDDANDDELNSFFNQIGRPESPDKYALPDVQAYEGLDLNAEKATFSKLAHESGLSNVQAAKLFKNYINTVNQEFAKSQEVLTQTFESAVKAAFPEDPNKGLGLAKKGAKAAGVADKMDEAGYSTNPLFLQLCAKLGELTGEDTLIRPQAASKETPLERARKLQSSPEYWKDPSIQREVEQLYKQAFPG